MFISNMERKNTSGQNTAKKWERVKREQRLKTTPRESQEKSAPSRDKTYDAASWSSHKCVCYYMFSLSLNTYTVCVEYTNEYEYISPTST